MQVRTPKLDDNCRARIRLPLAPRGVLWVAQLWNFLNSLSEEAGPDDFVDLQINGKGEVVILVPLNPAWHENFRDAWNGRRKRGRSCEALQKVKECNFDEKLLCRLKDFEANEVRNYLTSPLAKGVIHVSVSNREPCQIEIRWQGVLA